MYKFTRAFIHIDNPFFFRCSLPGFYFILQDIFPSIGSDTHGPKMHFKNTNSLAQPRLSKLESSEMGPSTYIVFKNLPRGSWCLPLPRDHYYNEDMVQKQQKCSRRSKFGQESWGRFYRGGNCLFFLNIPSYLQTAAVSFMVCKHHSMYLNAPGQCPKAAVFSLCSKVMWLSLPCGVRLPSTC